MERWIGPFLFGAAGFVFAVWALSLDSRRMGFARPRVPAPPSTKGRNKRLMLLPLTLAVTGTFIAAPDTGRKALAVILLALVVKGVFSRAKLRRRQAEMRREWPFLIESMAVAALSGMETGAAFQSAAGRTKGPLREETDRVLLRIMGGATLSRALEAADGAALPDVKRLRTLLARSEILGTPIAGILKAFSDEGYEAERQAMEERFNALPLQLSVITVFFLLPPVLAVSIIPHVLAFLEARW